MKITLISLMTMVFLALIFISCKPKIEKVTPLKPKIGEVTGILSYPNGEAYPQGVSVFLQKGNSADADLQFKTNKNGEFLLTNVKSGDYTLCILIPPKGDNQSGIGNDPIPTIGEVNCKGKPVSFTMPINEGINLGKIEVTEILQMK
jgi:hypothetical protein